MDLLTYVNSWKNCAINNVPTNVMQQWHDTYPELKMMNVWNFHHVRFLNGKYISYYRTPYREGDEFIGGVLQCVIDYSELAIGVPEDEDIDCTFVEIL